jgi:hypothetical protein
VQVPPRRIRTAGTDPTRSITLAMPVLLPVPLPPTAYPGEPGSGTIAARDNDKDRALDHAGDQR